MNFFSFVVVAAILVVQSSGFPDRESRIINGREATPGEAPYMIQVQLRNDTSFGQFCGGSLITTTRVVSAAHCFDWNFSPTWHFFAVAGQHNWRETSGHEQERRVESIHLHPNYTSSLGVFSGFDINFMDVESPFELNAWVQTIALPPSNFLHSGRVQIFGWGSTHPSIGQIPDILQTTHKEIVDRATCSEIFLVIFNGRDPTHFEDMCVLSPVGETQTDSCGGDSGGPLVQLNPNTGAPELVAVVAWGSSPCNAVNYPSVNTRTSPFVDFLTQ